MKEAEAERNGNLDAVRKIDLVPFSSVIEYFQYIVVLLFSKLTFWGSWLGICLILGWMQTG